MVCRGAGCNGDNWLRKAPGAAGPSADPATFNPTQLDTDQWAEVYKSFGVKGAVVTAKHGCGHLLWPTEVTFDDGSPYTYCVGKKDSAIKQDVLALFSVRHSTSKPQSTLFVYTHAVLYWDLFVKCHRHADDTTRSQLGPRHHWTNDHRDHLNGGGCWLHTPACHVGLCRSVTPH